MEERNETAEWSEDDQAYADFVSDLACEISADEGVVEDVLGTLIERGLLARSALLLANTGGTGNG